MPTVTVALKHPTGLILRLFKMVDMTEPVLGGGTRTVPKAVVDSERKAVTLAGTAAPVGRTAKVPVVGGFALNHGIDADFFEEWLKQNPDNDLVARGHLKAFAEDATGRAGSKATGHAKEMSAERSGLEPVNPKDLARELPRAGIARRGAIETVSDKEAA